MKSAVSPHLDKIIMINSSKKCAEVRVDPSISGVGEDPRVLHRSSDG